MVLLGWPNDVDARLNMPATLTFRQIEIAEVGFVQIPPRRPAPVAETGATTEQDLGNQATEEIEDETVTSFLALGADFITVNP